MQAWEEQVRELIRQGRVTEAMRLAASSGTKSQDFDWVAFARERAERYNAKPGSLTGYDCPICLNRGDFLVVNDEGYEFTRFCSCVKTRQAMRNIEKSGLAGLMDSMTFEAFRANEGWQRSALDIAMRYAKALTTGSTPWLFFGGQPGSGKTHLCTAVCGEVLRSGKAVRYLVWAEAIDRIKASRFDEEAMDELLEPYKAVPVLYIDDLFKSAYRARRDRNGGVSSPRPTPTDADVRICYEILNARYLRDLPTIVSCEWSLLDDLMDVDEATFSRVYQRATAEFVCEISRHSDRNYRMKGA